MLVAMLGAVGSPHTVAWQRALCPNAGSNTALSAVAEGGAAMLPKLSYGGHNGEGPWGQSLDRGAACAGELWGSRGGWWAAGGSLAGLPAREHPLGCDAWSTM